MTFQKQLKLLKIFVTRADARVNVIVTWRQILFSFLFSTNKLNNKYLYKTFKIFWINKEKSIKLQSHILTIILTKSKHWTK